MRRSLLGTLLALPLLALPAVAGAQADPEPASAPAASAWEEEPASADYLRPTQRLQEGISAYNSLDLDRAERALREAANATDPETRQRAQHYLGLTLQAAGRYSEAQAAFESVLRAGPLTGYFLESAKALVKLAGKNADESRVGTILDYAYDQSFAKLDRETVQRLNFLVGQVLRSRRAPEAEAYMKTLGSDAPDYARARLILAEARLDSGDYGQAASYANEVLALRNGSVTYSDLDKSQRAARAVLQRAQGSSTPSVASTPAPQPAAGASTAGPSASAKQAEEELRALAAMRKQAEAELKAAAEARRMAEENLRASEAAAKAAAAQPAPQSAKQLAPLPADPKRFALVIGIAEYDSDLPPSLGADSDAREFARLAQESLGVLPRNVFMLLGPKATKSRIDAMLDEQLPKLLDARSTLLVFFAGHGAPDVQTGEGYLVPWEADPKYIRSQGVKVQTLVSRLQALPAAHRYVFLDACFSGAGGRSVLPAGARPLVPVKNVVARAPSAGTVVFAAAGPDETTGATADGKHGLFSQFLLRGLSGDADSSGDGHVSTEELGRFLSDHVADEAARANRVQKPAVSGASANELLR